MLKIRDLRTDEVPQLKEFAPPEWKTDLSQLFGRHFGRPYFHPIGADLDGSLAGCASGLVHGNAGWLGNICVPPQHRGHGIGTALTEELIRLFRSKQLAFQILVATPLGEPIYRKLGFEVVSYYIFLERQGEAVSIEAAAGVRPFQPGDAEQIFELDTRLTGEMRRPFVSEFLEGAWVHTGPGGRLDGYFLPSLGNGLVIATNDEAGTALMQLKLRLGATSAVVPEQNQVARDFLRGHGFVETFRAPRMTLGPDSSWQPERVYCRGGGYCG